MSLDLANELSGRTSGPVWSADDPDPHGYAEERSGFDTALDQRPVLVVGAATAADIVVAVRFAGDHDLPVGLQATGHGANYAMDGGVLISTRRLTSVTVDHDQATAYVLAGATSGAVMGAATERGLAAVVGSAPGVGFVSFSLGGGLGPLGRTLGYAADRVRRLDVVTADGRQLAVSEHEHPELFWALRGGGGNLAAVTGIDIDLVALTSLYGGGLLFDGDQAPAVVEAFGQCASSAPDELTLSIAFLTFPDLPTLEPSLRGRFCCHVRVGYCGDADDGQRLIGPLRALPCLEDTVHTMAMADIGTIHADPVGPMPVYSSSLAVTIDAADALRAVLPFVGPSAPFVLEVRCLGGRLARPPRSDNAVGLRSAQSNVFTSAYPGTDPAAAMNAQQRVYDALAVSSAGGALRNFLPTGRHDASTSYEPTTAARLAELKKTWDPGNMFRFTPSI